MSEPLETLEQWLLQNLGRDLPPTMLGRPIKTSDRFITSLYIYTDMNKAGFINKNDKDYEKAKLILQKMLELEEELKFWESSEELPNLKDNVPRNFPDQIKTLLNSYRISIEKFSFGVGRSNIFSGKDTENLFISIYLARKNNMTLDDVFSFLAKAGEPPEKKKGTNDKSIGIILQRMSKMYGRPDAEQTALNEENVLLCNGRKLPRASKATYGKIYQRAWNASIVFEPISNKPGQCLCTYMPKGTDHLNETILSYDLVLRDLEQRINIGTLYNGYCQISTPQRFTGETLERLLKIM